MKTVVNLISVQSIAILFFALSFGSLYGQTNNVNPKSDYLMCSGTNATTDISGTFYDSGGETGNYSNGENCSFLINPGCAFSITMSFNSFQLEGCCDYFKVYDGSDNTGELLLNTSGYTIPDPVVANSGAMFITFTSDGSAIYSGWEAVWTSVVPTTPPIANFSISNTTPLFNSEVQFTDLTTNYPNGWDWDFGDGHSSNLQNPVHAFQQAGLHTITLISDNCFSTDTVSHELTVSEPPVIVISPSSIIETITDCNDSISTPLTISNNGNGPLEFNLTASNAIKNTVELLALTYGVDYYQEYQNTLNAINQHFTDYNLTEINTTSPTVLANELDGKQVLLVAEQEDGSSTVWLGFSGVLQEFVNNGGVVIFCGTVNYPCITNSGLFNISDVTDVYSTLTVVDDTHPITEGLPSTFQPVNATIAAYINNVDATMLVEYSSPYQVVSYREIGSGVAIYIAFDYYNFDYNSSKIIANAVEFGGNISSYGDWFSFSPESGVVDPGNSIIVDVSFNAQGLVNDIYEKNLIVESNASPQITVPCSYVLLGSPEVCVSNNVLEFGEIMVGADSTQEFHVCNSGCSQLVISNMVASSNAWSIMPLTMSIPPFQQTTVTVTFHPSSITQYDDTLFIYSNDSIKMVSLVGTGIGAPSIALSDDEIDVVIPDCDGIHNFPLTIYNNGDNLLDFEITGGSETIYDSISTQNYFTSGASTSHNFTQVPLYTDTLNITITLNGDYDDPSEYATLFIESSFSEQIDDGNPYNGSNIVKEYVFYGSQVNDWLNDGVLEVLIQNSYEVNTGMGGSDLHQVQVSCKGSQWLSFEPAGGTVAIDDSLVTNIMFNALGMTSGSYPSLCHILTNDPLNETVPFQVNMEIIGAPEISLSENCLNFGNVMAFTTVIDSVNIINSGCAPLIISEISNVFAEFEINIESTVIGPFSSEMIVVSFSPTTFEPFSDTIIILNNDSTVNICLSGTGFEGPIISANPTSLEYSLQACGDNTTDILTISNSGGTDLNFEIAFSNAKSSLEMLALTYGVDYNNEYQNTLNAINEYYTDYNLTEINTTNPTELQNALVGKNLLLIAEQEYGEPYVFSNFNPILQSFVNAGGYVIICGTGNYSCTTASGLFEIYDYWSTYYNLTVLDNTHPITMGLPDNFSASEYTYASYINNSDRTVLVRDAEANYDVVCYREIGLGYAIFIAFDYYTYSDEAARIIGQAVEFSNTNVDPDWLIFNELTGTIAPGGSNDLIISVNSEGLEGGVHETVININSNDPQTPVLIVPASLEVAYNLCSGFSYEIYGCSGHVEFYDETINTPTSWLWNFGDGETSTSINPTHTYTSTGSFQVSLSVTNSYGTDVTVQNIEITENFGPISANCYPEPNNGYYYWGISNVSFANINNSSEGSNAGFEDFTCIGFADVIQGVSYNMSVTTLSEETVRVWIDFDNSGSFETQEMMMNSVGGYSHSSEFEIPQECVFNVGLRMRVGSDSYNLPEPCVNPYYGQHEDYTIIIQSNTLPPVASINHDIIDECNGIVQFTDGSGNIPTSWLWEFGDGGTSADQNPLHIYTTAGMYTVTLTASNIFGTDIATKSILINSLYPEMEITGDFLEDEPMYFSNTTPGAISWLWNFGDGYASSLQNPEHIYTDHGVYQVILTVTNGILCQKSVFETIEIDEVIGINSLSNGELIVYPNPSSGKFIIQSAEPSGEIFVTVMSISGKKVYQGKIYGNGKAIKEDLNLQFLDQGIYLLKLYDNKNSTVHKLIIE